MKRLLALAMALCLALACAPALAEEDAAKQDETIAYALDEEACVLIVELKGNATTGYEWVCALSEEDMLCEVSTEYVPDEAEEGKEVLAGAGGKTVFVFETAMDGAGLITLTFSYGRAWEEEPILIYEMDVWVVENGTLSVEDIREKVGV